MYPIPANATRIRYLESTGTQYIDTGIVPSVPSDTVYCKMVSTGTYTDGTTEKRRYAFFGVLDGYGGNDFGARISWYAGYYGVETDNRVVAAIDPVDTNAIRGKLTEWTLGANERRVVYNGVTTTTQNVVTTSYTYSGSSWIFGANGTGTGGGGLLACRVYAYKFWRNGVLLQDFTPVRVGQVGYLFDRVSGQLFGNAADNNAGFPAECLGPDTFQQGVIPTRMMVGGVRKKKVWPTPLYTGVSLVGSSVQNNNGILSGFTGSSYATMPWRMTAGATSLEAVCRFTTRSIQSNVAQGIWGCVGSADAFTPFYLPAQSISTQFVNPVAYISSNGTSWNIETGGTLSSSFKVNVGESCTIKCSFGPGGYTWSYWSNGTWVTAKTNSATAAPYGSSSLVPQLGTNRGQNNPLNGTIDLNYTYLMRDGELLWEGAPGAYKNVKTTYPD